MWSLNSGHGWMEQMYDLWGSGYLGKKKQKQLLWAVMDVLLPGFFWEGGKEEKKRRGWVMEGGQLPWTHTPYTHTYTHTFFVIHTQLLKIHYKGLLSQARAASNRSSYFPNHIIYIYIPFGDMFVF